MVLVKELQPKRRLVSANSYFSIAKFSGFKSSKDIFFHRNTENTCNLGSKYFVFELIGKTSLKNNVSNFVQFERDRKEEKSVRLQIEK